MAGTKMRTSRDQRQCPTKKLKIVSDPATHQHNTELNEASKDLGFVYFNRVSRQHEVYTPADRAALSASLLKWALEDPEADKLSKFYKTRLICEETIRLLRKKYPELDEDCRLASDLIGCRLWSNALRRKWDPQTCIKFLPIYDEEYRSETIRMAELRIAQAQAEANKTIIVEMVDYGKDKNGK